VHLELAIVTDLLHEPQACEPDAEVRLAQQPGWAFADAIDPAWPRSRSTWTAQRGRPGQGAQLGYLPEPARNQVGSSHPEQQGATMECTPGDRVELVATNDPYTRLRPGDRGTVTSVADRPRAHHRHPVGQRQHPGHPARRR
jgi:Domain of unknown function (DUF4314)